MIYVCVCRAVKSGFMASFWLDRNNFKKALQEQHPIVPMNSDLLLGTLRNNQTKNCTTGHWNVNAGFLLFSIYYFKFPRKTSQMKHGGRVEGYSCTILTGILTAEGRSNKLAAREEEEEEEGRKGID